MSASIMYRKIFTDIEENFNTNNNNINIIYNIPLFLLILSNWDIYIPNIYKVKRISKIFFGINFASAK